MEDHPLASPRTPEPPGAAGRARWSAGAATMGAVLNGVLALGLFALAAVLLGSSQTALTSSGRREEFALGSLVGGIGLVLALLALFLSGLAVVCWVIRRRVRRASRAGTFDLIVLIAASVPPLAVAALVAGRMLR